MRTIIYLIMLVALVGCETSTEIKASRNMQTGEGTLYFKSPKDYGLIKGHVEYDDQGRTKVLDFEAQDVRNTAAQAQADVINNLVGSAERGWSRMPAQP